MNSLDVLEFILGIKNFVILYDNVPLAEKMGLKGGHLSIIFLCTLQKPYKTTGLEPSYVAQHLELLMILKILNIFCFFFPGLQENLVSLF